MKLPEELQNGIEALASGSDFKNLKSARSSVSEDYRQGLSSRNSFRNNDGLLSYLITRMPATFGACSAVFEEIRNRLPNFSPRSILDLGAGPGTATWAALDQFPEIEELHLIEREAEAIQIGKKLAANSPLANAKWQETSIERLENFPKVDIAVLSYVLTETQDFSAIDKLLQAQIPLVVVIEPGTPKGFERIRSIRQHLIDKGATLIAPCPHNKACPMTATDWCHFSARIERTRLHRLLKEGSLGYEDEKYSYIAFSPSLSIEPIKGRVVRPPQKGSGHIRLSLCASSGELEALTITRSNKEAYRDARDAEWGSAWLFSK